MVTKPLAPMSLAIVGAGGVTGAYAMAEAGARGLSPVIIGRDSARLRELIDSAGIAPDRVRIADIHDRRSLQTAFVGVSHVISTVAPFTRNGFEIARAAAELGLGYTDSSGETGFIARIGDELNAIAQRSGATLCTGNGVAAFLGDVATHWIAPLGDSAGQATIIYDIRDYRPSVGSIQSYLSNILPEGGAAMRDGRVVRLPLGAFAGAIGSCAGVQGIFPDAMIISRYWTARRIDALMQAPANSRLMIRGLAALATNRHVNRLLLALPLHRWLASAADHDGSSRCMVHVETIDGAGRHAYRSVRINRIYRGTAQVMLGTLIAMARRNDRPTGVRAASEMFSGFPEVLELTNVVETESLDGRRS